MAEKMKEALAKLAGTIEKAPENKRPEIQRFIEGFAAGLETTKDQTEKQEAV